jgi:hypothetical protein
MYVRVRRTIRKVAAGPLTGLSVAFISLTNGVLGHLQSGFAQAVRRAAAFLHLELRLLTDRLMNSVHDGEKTPERPLSPQDGALRSLLL